MNDLVYSLLPGVFFAGILAGSVFLTMGPEWSIVFLAFLFGVHIAKEHH